MKFKDYLKQLNDLAKESPGSLDLEVIYGADDEGNRFQKVVFSPSFKKVENLGEYNLEVVDEGDINAICIN